MKYLQLLMRTADDEPDQVHLGAEGEDEGEAAQRKEARSDGQRGTAYVPARAVLQGEAGESWLASGGQAA